MKEINFIKTCKLIQPIYRSLTGKGNYKTLKILKTINKDLKILSFKSGKKVFDWKIPLEWNIKDAWIKDFNNKKVLDFKNNFLSIVSYSNKINKFLTLKELKKKIHTLKKQPNLIPYVTSYYKKDWGFCMSYNDKKKLKNGKYQVSIDSSFKKGKLQIGEIYIPGKLKKEILLTTYICHPYMANNELSGPVVLIHLSNWIKKISKRKYSYRILFSSETIGTLSFIEKRLDTLKKNVIGGYVLSCVGDNRCYSLIKSKKENSLSNIIALKNFKRLAKKKKIYSWLQRGSDERQFNAPGVAIDIAGFSRSKYGEYKEYHSSDDQIGKVVTESGLKGSYNFMKKIIIDFENTEVPFTKIIGEPFLTKHKLVSELSKKDFRLKDKKNFLNLISFSDGTRRIEEIAKLAKLSLAKSKQLFQILKNKKIVNY